MADNFGVNVKEQPVQTPSPKGETVLPPSKDESPKQGKS